MYCIIEPVGVTLNRYTHSRKDTAAASGCISWCQLSLIFVWENKIKNGCGWSKDCLRKRRIFLGGDFVFGSCKSPAHTLQILESSGKLPSEEGMKSDGE